MADLRSMAQAGLSDVSGTPSMIIGRVRRVLNILESPSPIAPAERAITLHALAQMLEAAADNWTDYIIASSTRDEEE